MSDSEHDNKRRHPRVSLSLLVQYRFNSFEDFLAEYATNISVGGIFIKTDEPHDENEIIYLQFSLKDGSRLIEGMGRVVRSNKVAGDGTPAGMGIEFLSFDEESKVLIEEICAKRLGAEMPKH